MATSTKYAVQYTLVPRDPTTDVGTLFAAALDQWHEKKRLSIQPLSWGTPASRQFQDGTLFRWAPFADEGEAIADYVLRHPDQENAELSWVTRFSYLARREQSITSPYAGPVRFFLTAEVSVEGPPDLARHKFTSRPSLIPMLNDIFAISDGDLEFRTVARGVPTNGVGDFVQYTLEDPKRRFPIVVLSEQRERGFLVSPSTLATQYFAVAHVYTLGWREALTLSSEVGSIRSVYNGAMRIYFPGFSRTKSASSHPLVPAHRFGDSRFRTRLAAAISEETVRHFAEVELPTHTLAERRVLAYDAARARMAQQLKASVPPSELRSYQELVDAYEGETEEIRSRLDAANATIALLQQKNAALRHALSQVNGGAAKEDSAVQSLLAEEPPTTPLEAVERAAALTSDTLNILPSAYETAEESGYAQPELILDYLLALGEVAAKKHDDSLGTTLRDTFRARGIDYSPKNSENTETRLRAQYRFKDGATTYVCEEHLRRGNDPALGLRIYFDSETDDGRFVIGHIGRHLDTNTTN